MGGVIRFVGPFDTLHPTVQKTLRSLPPEHLEHYMSPPDPAVAQAAAEAAGAERVSDPHGDVLSCVLLGRLAEDGWLPGPEGFQMRCRTFREAAGTLLSRIAILPPGKRRRELLNRLALRARALLEEAEREIPPAIGESA